MTTGAVLRVHVAGVGLLGPGFTDWATGRSLLREPAGWTGHSTVVPAPGLLPATERRRAGAVVKASIAIAEEACTAAGIAAAELATVFTSSTGDPANCHALCEALATPDRPVSPTRFTNSVHNAAAGYWHIATRSRHASTSLCGFDASFGAGLLEAATQVVFTGRSVLLVACDVPYPEPLNGVRPLPDTFGAALVLSPDRGPGLSIQLAQAEAPTTCDDARLDALRSSIPAGRSLPLLQALARGGDASMVLDYLPDLVLRVALGADH